MFEFLPISGVFFIFILICGTAGGLFALLYRLFGKE